ncbi:hypothetical protein [Paracoccus sanguinis]|uniref:hypothetical protein n=1 Tax=Paracoccus sanguinis TaxID=1545044 RepID=UPI0012E03F53|nr:hypothetical protein [Paracoccus sanguinis]
MLTRILAAGFVLAGLPALANAAIIDNGTIQMGVDTLGQLNVGGGSPSSGGVSATGLRYMPYNYEATAPGCLCEGWGVGIGETGAAGYANNSSGTAGLTSVSFTSTGSTAKSVVTVNGTDLRVTHDFAPASETSNLYRVKVTIENTGTTNIADLRYTRTFDWDVEPTAFNEYVTIKGTGTTSSLRYANNNGFENSNPFASRGPLGGAPAMTDLSDFGPLDQGSNFDFGFGKLEAGKSYSFDIYYGAAATETEALAALGRVKAELYSLGQSSLDPAGTGSGPGGRPTATFIFGFTGVGGDVIVPDPDPAPVPVPASALLLLGGLGLLPLARRRRAG